MLKNSEEVKEVGDVVSDHLNGTFIVSAGSF